MAKFIKTAVTDLTGLEKTAILLSEIGPLYNDKYDELMEFLHLKTSEIKKIRKAIIKLGKYQPSGRGTEQGFAEIQREKIVLNEVMQFGKRRGIFNNNAGLQQSRQNVKNDFTEDLSEMIKNDPKEVAKILSSWLGE
ncbi:MAG: hypothetical protein IKZ04_03380 [Spirochaetaceae bacterium]|nr:hypothetical protein [Spirochaetaceae bacterium]